MSDSANETHMIRTLGDLAKVATPENLDDLIADVRLFVCELNVLEIKVGRLEEPVMIWTDDGENKITEGEITCADGKTIVLNYTATTNPPQL